MRSVGIYCVVLLLACLVAGDCVAQRSHFLRLELTDADRLPAGFRTPRETASAAAASETLNTLVADLQAAGWISVELQILHQDADSTRASMLLGEPLRWLYLKGGNVDERTLRSIGFRERQYPERPFRFREVERIMERLLREVENTGYPFASVQLDSILLEPETVSASLSLDRYRFIILDSLRQMGPAKVAPAYLRQYLDLREGQPYDESAVLAISTRVRELGFVKEMQDPVVRFYGDQAVIGIYLDEINANQFDILLGVLPNSAVTGQLAITGEVNLLLVNTVGLGERMRLAYRRLQAGTQELDLNLAFPYLPYLPVGAKLDFDLYLRDTTFLERGTDFGIQYAFGGADYVEGFYENERFVLLDPDTGSVRQNRVLPENLDVAVNRYGLAVQRERLDYRYNPRRGWRVHLRAAAGTREVLENNRISGIVDPAEPEFDYATLYDTVAGRVASFRLSGKSAWFLPLGGRSTVMVGWEGGFLSGGRLLRNELFRLGGYRRLRGFDEESIFASHYHIGTLEYRFLLSTNSYVSLFSDLAWLEENRLGENRRDTPIGFGAGLDIETGAGIFGIRYALGRQRGNPIQFREAKIHFGYVNRF